MDGRYTVSLNKVSAIEFSLNNTENTCDGDQPVELNTTSCITKIDGTNLTFVIKSFTSI